MKTLEAQLIAEKLKFWYCPQIGGVCHHDCYCYVEPKIIVVESNPDRVISQAYCSHALHQEEFEVNARVIH